MVEDAWARWKTAVVLWCISFLACAEHYLHQNGNLAQRGEHRFVILQYVSQHGPPTICPLFDLYDPWL